MSATRTSLVRVRTRHQISEADFLVLGQLVIVGLGPGAQEKRGRREVGGWKEGVLERG